MKRFTSTAKWRDPWFHRLSPNTKLICLYVLDNCDAAGVWEPNFFAAEADIGFAAAGLKIAWHEVFKELNQPAEHPRPNNRRADKPRVALPAPRVLLTQTGQWWVSAFCLFQYGMLRANQPSHLPALRSLQAHDLLATYAELFPEGITESARAGVPEKFPFPKARRLPTLEEVRGWPEAAGAEDVELQIFYHHYAALGWRQPSGRLFADFRALLAKWRLADGGRAGEDLAAGTVPAITLRLQEINARLQELGRNTFQLHPNAAPQLRPEALEELARLRTERTQLQSRLAYGRNHHPNDQI